MSNLDNDIDFWLYNEIRNFFDNGGTLGGFHKVLACFFENYELQELYVGNSEIKEVKHD